MFTRFKVTMVLCLLLLSALSGIPASAQSATTIITVFHFSDYHAHAVPFYSEGQSDQGGVARAIGFLKAQKEANPNALIFNGGDMFNKSSPTWSDEYQCAEWPWFNGLVDAMALGNHEFDYGQATFKACQATINYPILSSNYVGADGNPLLTGADGKSYFVKTVDGIKIGAFSLAGSDFPALVAKANLPAGAVFADRTEAAKKIVATLRDTEKVDVVILFGHALREDDYALAQAVPGIDLILGTHSHYKGEFTKIDGTSTYYISPFQYLTYISQVDMTFTGGKLSGMQGKLVKMDASKAEDPAIAAQVNTMQKALEAKYPDRFKVLGTAAVELSDANISTDESVLGNWSMEVVRAAAGTNAFFSTSSSFRAAIPPGPITVEAFFTAIPYKNSIVTADMTGQQVADFLNVVAKARGSDSFCQESGARFKIQDGKATDIQLLVDPANPASGYAPLDLAKTYKIGVTNFMSGVSALYKPIFAAAANVTDTKQDIGTLLTDTIQSAGTITGSLDGRMGTAVPAQPTPVQATPTQAIPAQATPTQAIPSAPVPGVTPPGMPTTGSPGTETLWWLVGSLLALVLGSAALLLARRQPAKR